MDLQWQKSWGSLLKPMPVAPWPAVDTLRGALMTEFPWLVDAITSLLGDLELQAAVSGTATRVLPSVLVGPPGCGKSRLLNRLVSLHRGMVLNMSGATDNRTLAGTSRGWSSTHPSAPSIAASRTGCLNPLLGLDELDKVGALDGRNGDPRQSLLTMLEPTTAAAWLDEGLGMPVDLSRVSWVATANDWTAIPALLRTRLRRLDCGLPRAQDFGALWNGCLGDLALELGVEAWALPQVNDAARGMAEDGYRRGPLSARALSRVVRVAVVAAGAGERAASRH